MATNHIVYSHQINLGAVISIAGWTCKVDKIHNPNVLEADLFIHLVLLPMDPPAEVRIDLVLPRAFPIEVHSN